MGLRSSGLDDATLMKRIARGDTQAFDFFYQRHSAAVYTYLLRLLHDVQTAEDVLQETFLAVWQGAHRFFGRAQVRTWLLSIAHRRAMDWLRTNGTQGNGYDLELNEDVEDSVGSEPPVWEHEIAQTEAIQQALDQLSPEHRAVLELAFYYECSYAEIAEIIGCPVGTVKSRLHAARHQLQVLLRHLVTSRATSGGRR